MLNLQTISENTFAVRDGEMDPDDFRDWFLGYSRGHRGPRGNRVADALAAIDMVLVEYSNGEIEETRLGQELLSAIRPFAQAELKMIAQGSSRISFGPDVTADSPNRILMPIRKESSASSQNEPQVGFARQPDRLRKLPSNIRQRGKPLSVAAR